MGLLGGVRCVGMCGGIVSAFSVATPRHRPFPVAIATESHRFSIIADGGPRVLAFNAGRIGSYMLAGALAGLLGSVPALLDLVALQTAAYWLANLMLVALGLTLMNVWHGLSRVEAIAQFLWRRIQPLIRRLLPVTHMWQAMALGGLWGWVPCGMVYSVLMTALLTGSATQGAMVMLAFGLGTLPMLLAAGATLKHLQQLRHSLLSRRIAGAVLILFGL